MCYTEVMFIVSSDWHCQPEELIPEAMKLIGQAEPGDTLVGVGDLFDFLPLGKEKFKNSKAIDDFINLLGGREFYYVAGNHDPYPWVKERFSKHGNIKVVRNVNFDNRWYFRHGHGWSHDWWLLRHFAPSVVELMADRLPRPWYWFSKKMGWIPSEDKAAISSPYPLHYGEGRERMERQKYNDKVGVVWRNALRYAQHNNISVIVGHTHCSGVLIRANNGSKAVIADGGDLRDGTYLVIDADVQLCTL